MTPYLQGLDLLGPGQVGPLLVADWGLFLSDCFFFVSSLFDPPQGFLVHLVHQLFLMLLPLLVRRVLVTELVLQDGCPLAPKKHHKTPHI